MGFASIPKMDKEKEAKKTRWREELLRARVIAIEKRRNDLRFEYMVQLFSSYYGAEPKRAEKEREELEKEIDEIYSQIEKGTLKWDSPTIFRRLWKFDTKVFGYLNKWFNFSTVTKGFEIVKDNDEYEE